MPQLPSVSELLVGGHIRPVPLRSSVSSPDAGPAPLGSSPRQTDSSISISYPRSTDPAPKFHSTGSSPTVPKPGDMHPAPSHSSYPRMDPGLPLPNVSSRRASSEYATPGYDRSYVAHTAPPNDYFSYCDPHPTRLMTDSRQHSTEQLNRIPSYHSSASTESIHKLGTTPPAVSSPDSRNRPRPASFSHAPITSILYNGPKGPAHIPPAVPVNTAFPHAPPQSCTSPQGAPSMYGPAYKYSQHQYSVHSAGNPIHTPGPVPMHNNPHQGLVPMHASAPMSNPMTTPVHSGNVHPSLHSSLNGHNHAVHSTAIHSAIYAQPFHGPDQQALNREQNNALINKRRVTKRRTRSGCMTCRKRRIKCDERKPHCYNCERSKKLCLGYELVSSNTRRAQESEVPKAKARLSVQSLM